MIGKTLECMHDELVSTQPIDRLHGRSSVHIICRHVYKHGSYNCAAPQHPSRAESALHPRRSQPHPCAAPPPLSRRHGSDSILTSVTGPLTSSGHLTGRADRAADAEDAGEDGALAAPAATAATSEAAHRVEEVTGNTEQ